MEKLDQPVNESWFGEGEIIDADLLVDLLETYRFGKANVPIRKSRSKAAETAASDITTDMEDEEDNNGSSGNKSVHEITSSASSNSDPIMLETTISNDEPGLNDDEVGSIDDEHSTNGETGYNWLESSSTNLPNVEIERQPKAEDSEIEEGEEENSERLLSEQEEESNLETLLAIQESYEVYCPNCSSCITRKVILKKRSHGDESSGIEVIEPPVKAHVPESRIEGKEEDEMFTCLACLKYFIRLGIRFLQLDYLMDKPVMEPGLTQNKLEQESFAVELLKSTVYGGLTETITSLVVVFSASASGSCTVNILALAVANLAGGFIVLAQNLQDLRNKSDKEKDQYQELLGRRGNFRLHNLVAVLSYIFFGLIPPLVYAFSFYQTGIKNYKLTSVFSISLVCVILLGMIKVYLRKPANAKSYLKSTTHYTSIVVASSGISYIVGDIGGEYIRKLGWFSLNQFGITSPFVGTIPDEYRFTYS